MRAMNGKYAAHIFIDCIDAYGEPSGDWSTCPYCSLKPRVWEFDNGRSTVCGCRVSTYNHFSIHAESIASTFKRTGGLAEHDTDALRKNWNHWCETGEVTFKHASLRDDGRW